MKIACPTWLTKCDAAEIEEAYEEATADCYGDERASGLVDMAVQELVVPFTESPSGSRSKLPMRLLPGTLLSRLPISEFRFKLLLWDTQR